MEIICTSCGRAQIKANHNFEYNRRKCRSCRRRESRQRVRDAKSDLTSVYYIPEHHYVGITDNVVNRMRVHKNNDFITEDYEIIANFERRVDAHYLETLLHMRGYNGFNKNC